MKKPGCIRLDQFFLFAGLGVGDDVDDETEAPVQLCHLLVKDDDAHNGRRTACGLPTLWFGSLITKEQIGAGAIEITCPKCLRILADKIETHLTRLEVGYPEAWKPRNPEGAGWKTDRAPPLPRDATGMPVLPERAERCSVTRTGEGVLRVVTSEAIGGDASNIALGLSTGDVVNVSKGANDREWEIRSFVKAEGSPLTAEDVPGAIQNLAIGVLRIDPADPVQLRDWLVLQIKRLAAGEGGAGCPIVDGMARKLTHLKVWILESGERREITTESCVYSGFKAENAIDSMTDFAREHARGYHARGLSPQYFLCDYFGSTVHVHEWDLHISSLGVIDHG